jgi:hypothetical protein
MEFGEQTGLNDQFFVTTSDAMKMISSTLYIVLAAGEEFTRPGYQYFAENILKYVVHEKFQFQVEPLNTMQSAIRRDFHIDKWE